MTLRTRSPRSMRGDGLLLILLAGVPLAAFVLLMAVPSLDGEFTSALFHMVAVSLVSASALQVAVMASVAASRARQPQVVLLALGCLFMGLFMLAHGLLTPGVGGRPVNLWVGRTPWLALVSFAACLSGVVARPARRLLRLMAAHHRLSLLAPASVVAVASAAMVLWPTAGIGGSALPHETGVRQVVSALAGLALLVSAGVSWRRWRLGRDRVQIALVLASVLAAEALLSLEVGRLGHISWWGHHVLLVAGFAIAVHSVFSEQRRNRTIEGALSSILLTDPLDHIARGYPDALKALVAAVEAKDVYTHGHSSRVAELSVGMAQRMGLGPNFMRRLAQGALLHDIGKIGIPDHILNKAGPLNQDERTWIEQHPVIGHEMVHRAASLGDAMVVVRHHHERYDGSGYPDGLAGDAIPLEARIVAVADVWDALRSDRAYRPAWPVQRALDHLEAGRGSHFDPACLDALLSLLSADGVGSAGGDDAQHEDDTPARVGGPHEEGEATDACHHHLPERVGAAVSLALLVDPIRRWGGLAGPVARI